MHRLLFFDSLTMKLRGLVGRFFRERIMVWVCSSPNAGRLFKQTAFHPAGAAVRHNARTLIRQMFRWIYDLSL